MSEQQRRVMATLVAFDGLVADTDGARALAVADALTAEAIRCTIERARAFVVGRTLEEAIERALSDPADLSSRGFDATLRDLAVLRARRSFSAMVAQGLPLMDGVGAWMRARAGSHGRIILRAESARRDVERILEFSGLGDVVTFVRCADDPPRPRGHAAIVESWSAIMSRTSALGVSPTQCAAYERHDECAGIARRHLSDVVVVESLLQAKY